MEIEEFKLERLQSVWENTVEINLTESGIHPYTLRELLQPEEIERLLDLRLTYGCTNGSPRLREAIAAYYPSTTRANVLVTNGSAEANFLAAWTLVSPGDEVVVMVPNYLQIWGLARSLGAVVKPFHLRESTGWAPDLDELRRQLSKRTKMICLCYPNNPTGALLSRREMETVVELAEEAGAVVYADEVYKGAELDGEEGPSFRDLTDRAIVASGLSKSLAHPGLRLGWLVGPEDFIAAAWHRHDYTTIAPGQLSQQVACTILDPGRRQEILARNREILRRNRDLLSAWIEERSETFSWIPPRAGGMAFLRYRAPFGSTELFDYLRRKKSLLILPGDVYGMDGYFRLGLGEPTEVLQRGLARLAEGFAELAEEGGVR
ncbi:MAG: aminotransferase class I/II-fold pyridoxal phosphate-dependent enzyme [Acidobacteria bacterium]|nr:aminotransferase class I/II-fold pyridoxal phosphate-dependent enzyme [Acidobacteriota bacterium]